MADRPVGFFKEGGRIKPRHTKNGVNETDLSIKEKGAGEKIEVKIDPRKKPMRTIEKLIDRIKVSFKDDGYGPYFDDDKERGKHETSTKLLFQTMENHSLFHLVIL